MVQVSGQFLTPIAHPNVYKNGHIDFCNGLYHDTGGTIREIRSVVKWLWDLLLRPDQRFAFIGNPDRLNQDDFNRSAEKMTREHATFEGAKSISSHFHTTRPRCKLHIWLGLLSEYFGCVNGTATHLLMYFPQIYCSMEDLRLQCFTVVARTCGSGISTTPSRRIFLGSFKHACIRCTSAKCYDGAAINPVNALALCNVVIRHSRL